MHTSFSKSHPLCRSRHVARDHGNPVAGVFHSRSWGAEIAISPPGYFWCVLECSSYPKSLPGALQLARRAQRRAREIGLRHLLVPARPQGPGAQRVALEARVVAAELTRRVWAALKAVLEATPGRLECSSVAVC